jgi:hydroxymethylbilane synthase
MSPASDHAAARGALRLGTRGSQLALWQARAVAAAIRDAGGPACTIVVIKTSGDRLQEAPLSDVGGKRLFVKEIEDALLSGDIDLAVHSSKDMPAQLPPGLRIGAVLPREDPHDAVVMPASRPMQASVLEEVVAALGQAPSIGTGSVRRIAQLVRLVPGARFMPVRGNLDTRLRKLDEGSHDALVLAAAGLRRLGFGPRISFVLPAAVCVPAPGQGIVAVEIRTGDDRALRAVAPINDGAAGAALAAERAVVEALGGGCQTPIGALAVPVGDRMLDVTAAVAAIDGSRVIRASERGRWDDAAETGARVGAQLLAAGAGDLLADAQREQGAVGGIQP